MHLILSYFDQIMGPSFLLTSHPHLAIYLKNTITDLMDINIDKGFFEYNYYSEDYEVFLANYYFEIPSDWGRGRIDRLMLSIALDPIQNPKAFKGLLEKYGEIIQNIPDIYLALYDPEENGEMAHEIREKKKKIEQIFQGLVQDCDDLLAERVLGEIIVIGLSKVGKTSLLNTINQKAFDPTIRPTLGIQVTKVVLENYRVNAFDVGGQTRLRRLFKRVLSAPMGIIYVVDVTFNEEQIKEAREMFHDVMTHYFGENCFQCPPDEIPVLILGNKIDLNEAFEKKKITSWLKLEEYDMDFHVDLVSALENTNVFSSFRWLVKKLMDIND